MLAAHLPVSKVPGDHEAKMTHLLTTTNEASLAGTEQATHAFKLAVFGVIAPKRVLAHEDLFAVSQARPCRISTFSSLQATPRRGWVIPAKA